MTNKNYQIAKFYTKLFEIKDCINDELLPTGEVVAVETNDQKLFKSLETLARNIEEHLKNYELSVGRNLK